MQYGLNFNVPFNAVKNARHLTKIGMGQFLFFGKGNFDDWTPYVGAVAQDGSLVCAYPSDKYYFELVAILANGHGADKVYDDIRHVFEHCGTAPDDRLIRSIFNISLTYGVNHELAYNMLMHMYFGMISEENKPGTFLGKTLKMNGAYSFLRAGRPFDAAADACRGRGWQDIQAECVSRGIYRF